MTNNISQNNLFKDSHNRAVYTTPKISKLGSIAELTQGMFGNYSDNMGSNMGMNMTMG